MGFCGVAEPSHCSVRNTEKDVARGVGNTSNTLESRDPENDQDKYALPQLTAKPRLRQTCLRG